MTAYYLVSAIAFLFLFVIWNRGDVFNLIAKFVWLAFSVWGFVAWLGAKHYLNLPQ